MAETIPYSTGSCTTGWDAMRDDRPAPAAGAKEKHR
jgi:hypothetical protein